MSNLAEISTKEKTKTKKVLISYATMFVCGVVIALLAMLVAYTFNHWHPLSASWAKLIEYLGYVGWCATLGMRGWDIQTWNGETFPEKLNSTLAKLFSLIAIFSFVLARELIPVG